VGLNERVQEIVGPVLRDLGLALYDVEHGGGTLKVTIDREGGVDLEAIAQATRLVSRELDRTDPLPGAYTLEVTSPGLERALRRPAHFRGAVGTVVSVRTHGGVEGERRVQGTLVEADDDGIVVRAGSTEATRRLRYDEIERARTVFEWGPAPKPGGRRPRPQSAPDQEAASS